MVAIWGGMLGEVRTVSVVAKLEHKLVACFRILRQCEAFLLRAGREAVIWE